jgi:hypothetical protein
MFFFRASMMPMAREMQARCGGILCRPSVALWRRKVRFRRGGNILWLCQSTSALLSRSQSSTASIRLTYLDILKYPRRHLTARLRHRCPWSRTWRTRRTTTQYGIAQGIIPEPTRVATTGSKRRERRILHRAGFRVMPAATLDRHVRFPEEALQLSLHAIAHARLGAIGGHGGGTRNGRPSIITLGDEVHATAGRVTRRYLSQILIAIVEKAASEDGLWFLRRAIGVGGPVHGARGRWVAIDVGYVARKGFGSVVRGGHGSVGLPWCDVGTIISMMWVGFGLDDGQW